MNNTVEVCSEVVDFAIENSFKLRPYQTKCIESLFLCECLGKKRVLVAAPTGSGKTVIFASYIGERFKRKLSKRVLVLAHTNELLEQSAEKIEQISYIKPGIVDAHHKEFDAQVVVSSIQSAYNINNLNQLMKQRFDTCIYDECHRSASKSARYILKSLGFGPGTSKMLVGFTATPFRHSKRFGLKEVFDEIAYEISIQDLIKNSYLVEPIGHYIATDIDLSSVPTVNGDFVETSLAKVMDTPEMVSSVVEMWKKSAENRKTIFFGVNVAHATHVADEFCKNGVNAEVVSGKTDWSTRCSIIKEFRKPDSHIKVLCNAQVLTEGIDIPEVSCIIMSPTKSLIRATQAFGRGLRSAPWVNKRDCIFLTYDDHDHKICSPAVLLSDAELIPMGSVKGKQKTPPELNPTLKSVLIGYNPLGKSFSWKMNNSNYVLLGQNDISLTVVKSGHDTYDVVYLQDEKFMVIAQKIGFELAFGIAEDFAKEHKTLFILNDKNAAWRHLPATEKQVNCIKKKGYSAGIDKLTRGQASVLIDWLFINK